MYAVRTCCSLVTTLLIAMCRGGGMNSTEGLLVFICCCCCSCRWQRWRVLIRALRYTDHVTARLPFTLMAARVLSAVTMVTSWLAASASSVTLTSLDLLSGPTTRPPAKVSLTQGALKLLGLTSHHRPHATAIGTIWELVTAPPITASLWHSGTSGVAIKTFRTEFWKFYPNF